MLLKLLIMLLSNAPKISLYYAPIMLKAVPLCPNHASTILELNAQLEYFICDYECSIGVFYLGGDCSIRVYRSFSIIASGKTGLLP